MDAEVRDVRGRPSENADRRRSIVRRVTLVCLVSAAAAGAVALAPLSSSADAGKPCVNRCGTLVARGSHPKPCAKVCRTVIKSTPHTKRWASSEVLHANLKVTVKVGHKVMKPTYYRRHGELCVGYY